MSAAAFGVRPSPPRLERISSGRTFATSTGRVARRPSWRAGGSSFCCRGVAAAIALRVDSGTEDELEDDADKAPLDACDEVEPDEAAALDADDLACALGSTAAAGFADAFTEAFSAGFEAAVEAGFGCGLAATGAAGFASTFFASVILAPAFAGAALPASCCVTLPTLIVPRGSIFGSRDGVRAETTLSAAFTGFPEPTCAPPTTDLRTFESDADEPETLRLPRAEESFAIGRRG